MKRPTTIIILLASILGLSLVYAANSNPGPRLSNNQPPLAPRDSIEEDQDVLSFLTVHLTSKTVFIFWKRANRR
jgi:hypothetical protein